VRRVIEVSPYGCLRVFCGKFTQKEDPDKCTSVPEPEMPELPDSFTFQGGRLFYLDAAGTLNSWLAFFQAFNTGGNSSYETVFLPRLIALDEWRKLTGRMV
jgi:hypothetical protein